MRVPPINGYVWSKIGFEIGAETKNFGAETKDGGWGCVKRFFTALRAELCFERHFILTISRSEIVKMKCLSEEYSAAAGGKRLITQPQDFLHNLNIKFCRRWRHFLIILGNRVASAARLPRIKTKNRGQVFAFFRPPSACRFVAQPCPGKKEGGTYFLDRDHCPFSTLDWVNGLFRALVAGWRTAAV